MIIISTIKFKKKFPIIYVLESSILWFDRLVHDNYDYMHRLINLYHILAFQIEKRSQV